jgi:hypothetical protein
MQDPILTHRLKPEGCRAADIDELVGQLPHPHTVIVGRTW